MSVKTYWMLSWYGLRLKRYVRYGSCSIPERQRNGHIKQTIVSGIENRTTKISLRNWGAQKRRGSPSGRRRFYTRGHTECTLLGNKYLHLRWREQLIQKKPAQSVYVCGNWRWNLKGQLKLECEASLHMSAGCHLYMCDIDTLLFNVQTM